MPLQTEKAGDCRGTEVDGTMSEKWCSLCYADGKFINPDTSLEEMKQIVDRALKEQKSGFLMRKMALMQLPTLGRWKKAS